MFLNKLKVMLSFSKGYLMALIVFLGGLFINSKKVFWFSDANNFGDIITPFLVKSFGVKHVNKINTRFYLFGENYLTIGSILSMANKKSIVWGAGFISRDSDFIYSKPKKILAVRGPKTRRRLLELGVECPEVYGDPALLLPLFYEIPDIRKKYKIGIVPHYIDKECEWLKDVKKPDIKIIDVQNKNCLEFVNEINECEIILSSSLHGIIVADAYKVPSYWVEFSNLVKGNGFKFLDYFESVGRKDRKPIRIDENSSVDFILKSIEVYDLKIDLSELLNSCPFIKKKK